MAYNETELKGLFNRVLNEKKEVEVKDEAFLKRYFNEVFPEGRPTSPEAMHQFNAIIVQIADEISRQRATKVFEILADVDFVNARNVYKYELPRNHKTKIVWAADGTSVQRQRVEGDTFRIAQPRRFQGGFYYEPMSLVDADVSRFRELIANIVEAKEALYWQQLSALTAQAVASMAIPEKNVLEGANLTLAQYRALGDVIKRYGGRPVFIADTALISHFAQQQANVADYAQGLSNERKNTLFNDIEITTIANTNAVTLINPYIAGSGNTKTQLPVNEGYMFAGAVNQKPFKIIEFGNLVQQSEYHYEIEQVELKFYAYVAIEFVQGEAVGYIKDTAVVL